MSFLLRLAASVGATLVSPLVRSALASALGATRGSARGVATSADAGDGAEVDWRELGAALADAEVTGAGGLATSPSLTPEREVSATQATSAMVVSAAPTRGRRTRDMAAGSLVTRKLGERQCTACAVRR
ncbi:MAG TPA: hypothetical protein VFP90_05420, partial [Gemmatimonadaceae bacterium]|nr:hypothetical protein [Gemmatimonadaceae bacterium]